MKTATKTKFKHTEIGTLPGDWGVAKFRAILSGNIRHGIYKPKESADPRGVRLLKMGNVNSNDRISDQNMERVLVSEDELERFRINDGNLVFARTSMMTGGLGNCSIVMKHNDPIIFDGNLLCAEIDTNIAEPEFYLYYFQSKRGQEEIARMTTGTQSRNIPGSKLMEVNVPILNKHEQGQIASILSCLDSKVELNQKMNKTLEAMAQAIFKHWFVDLEFPNKEGKPYRSSGGEMVYDEALGKEIPKAWNVGRIGEVALLTKTQISPNENPEKTYYHFSIEAYDSGMNPSLQLGSEILSNKFIVQSKTVLVSKLNPRIPRVWPVINAEEDSICSTEFLPFKPKGNAFSYFYNLVSSNAINKKLLQMARGTSSSHQRVSADDILNLPIYIPEQEILKSFELKVLTNMMKQEQNTTIQRPVTQIRDMLLPRLMSGKIRVRLEAR